MTPTEKAKFLWQVLDDTSTAFDVYKPEMTDFAKTVQKLAARRNKVFESDGYKLTSPKK